jgi:hypothetical protein
VKVKKILNLEEGNFRVLIEVLEGEDGGLHDYGIPRRAWLRAAQFITRFGTERALEVIDQRAERAADRGDFETSRRWRELITAIHAMQDNELLPGDEIH